MDTPGYYARAKADRKFKALFAPAPRERALRPPQRHPPACPGTRRSRTRGEKWWRWYTAPGEDQEKSVVSGWLCSMMMAVTCRAHLQTRGHTMPDEIITDLTQIQRASVAKEDENMAFRTFVKLEVELSDRPLNTLVS